MFVTVIQWQFWKYIILGLKITLKLHEINFSKENIHFGNNNMYAAFTKQVQMLKEKIICTK